MRFFALLFVISLVFAKEYYSGYEYRFKTEDQTDVLDPENDNFFVVGFNGNQCSDCTWQQYILALSVYRFEIFKDVVIASADTDEVPDLAEFCQVDIESARVEFRIIYPHATHCVEYDYDGDATIVDWISSVIGRKSRVSYVRELSGNAIEKELEDHSRNYFIDFFVPGNEACYSFSLDVERVAETYGLEPSIEFIRIDCSLNIDLCENTYHIEHFPSYRFISADGNEKKDVHPTKATPFAFIDFINEKANLYRVLGGGLNEQYGREPLIDKQLPAFIEGDEATQREIMKDVYRHRNTYKSAALYYKFMKEYLKEGQTFVERTINETDRELTKLYKIECYISFPRDFSAIYKEVFKRRGWRHGFAAMNAVSNSHIRDRMGIETHPEIRYFPKNCDLFNPRLIEIEDKTVENIVQWLDDEYEGKHKNDTETTSEPITENQSETQTETETETETEDVEL
ncbi:hypothetical protein WA158_000639 [Blastocystis sp. Blastoise]